MNDSTFGIIPVQRNNGKDSFLVVKSRSGHWSFPKGHAESGESSLETAARELYEETGLKKVTFITQETFSETRISVEFDETILKTTIWYLCFIDQNEKVNIQDTDEIVEYRWLGFDDAYELLSHDETKRVFLDARNFLTEFELEKMTLA